MTDFTFPSPHPFSQAVFHDLLGGEPTVLGVTTQEVDGETICKVDFEDGHVFDPADVMATYAESVDYTARARMKDVVREMATNIRLSVAGNPDAIKVAQWTRKVDRATRIVAGNPEPSDLEIIGTEIAIRGKGETPEALAAVHLAKDIALGKAAAMVDGMEDKAMDLLMAAPLEDLPQIATQLQAEADLLLYQIAQGA